MNEHKTSSDVESSETSEDHGGEKRYHVEVIKAVRPEGYEGAVRKKRKGKKPIYKEYLVKWANYSSDDNTWEPEENVARCQRLLESLWKNLGMRPDEYTGRSILVPTDEWIEGEKKFFAKQFRDKQLRRERKKQEAQEKKSKAGYSSSRNSPEAGSSSEYEGKANHYESSEDERPLKTRPLKITIPSHRKRKRVESPVSSDDEPLINQKRVKSMTVGLQTIQAAPSIAPSSPIHSTSGLFSDSETSPVLAKPTLRILPQKAPEAKIANTPTLASAPVGGISTKQRLAQGALAPTLPKDVVNTKAKAKPLPNRTNSSSSQLLSLRFKKKNDSVPAPSGSGVRLDPTSTTPLQSPIVNEPTLASLNLTSPTAESPDPQNAFHDHTSQDDIQTNPDNFISQNDISTPQTIQDIFHQSEADIFLQSIMPSELSAPFPTAPEKPFEIAPPKALRSKLPPIPRVPKIWKWTGPVHLGYKKERIFEGELKHHLSDEHSLKFSAIFQNIESIEITKLHDNVDMRSHLSAFQPPQQIALFTPAQEKDCEAFKTLLAYLQKKQQFFMVPVILDGNTIGQTIFFPWINNLLFPLNHTDLPPDPTLSTGDHLIAVLLLYALVPGQIQEAGLRPVTLARKDVTPLCEKGTWEKFLRSKPMFHYAARILGFKKQFYDYIASNSGDRQYIIWSQKDPKTKKKEGFETRCLLTILEQTGAKQESHRSHARMIFCHVSALETLHRLPGFAERRSITHPIMQQFYTYGTHEDVPSSLWSIQEIFPLGGVVTFTPSAMQLDTIGVINLIRRIDAHPLWCAYIVPVALGVLAKMECGNDDPLATFDMGKLGMGAILEAIEEGSVALISAPPRVTHPKYQTFLEQWQLDHCDLRPPTQRDALKKGIEPFLQNNGMLKAEAPIRTNMIETEIKNDMLAMQMQPKIMTNYRRYVIIDSKEGIQAKQSEKYVQGMEWTTSENFDFRDEFYPRNTVIKPTAASIVSPATALTK